MMLHAVANKESQQTDTIYFTFIKKKKKTWDLNDVYTYYIIDFFSYILLTFVNVD